MKALVTALCITAAILSPTTHARADGPMEFEGQPITDVDLEGSGADETSPRALGIPLGAPYSPGLLRIALDRLISIGIFADVQFDVEPTTSGVRLIVTLTPRLIVSRVEALGNDLVDDEEIARTMQISAGAEIERDNLDELIRRVIEMYKERGYPDASAQATLRDTDDVARKVLVIQVREGSPLRLSRIVFHGDGPQGTTERRVVEAIGLTGGDVLDRRLINDGMRSAEEQLRQLGHLEARLGPAVATRGSRGGVLTIESSVGPRYEIILRGHAPLTRSEIEESLKLGEERLAGTAGEHTLRDRVLDLYRRRGFVDVSVAVMRERVSTPRVIRLVIAIEAGEQVQVLAIGFPGAQHFPTSFLRNQVVSYLEEDVEGSTISYPVDSDTATRVVATGDLRGRERSVPQPFVVEPEHVYYEPTYVEAIEHIKELYQAEGYLSVHIGPARLMRISPTRAAVSIPVDEGARTMLFATDMVGNSALSARELLIEGGLTDGSAFSYLSLEEARLKMVGLYRERGFLYVRIEPSVRFSGDRTRAEITFQVIERFPVRIREVLIRGLEHTNERLVRQRITLSEGELYRPSLAHESEERLLSLGVFTGITIAPEDEDLAERDKRIIITVTERDPHHIEALAGVSTGEGLRGSFEYGYGNLGGQAISLTFRLQLAYQFFFVEQVVQDRYDRLTLGERLGQRVSASLTFPNFFNIPNVRASIDAVGIRANERDFGYWKAGLIGTLSYNPVRRLTTSLSGELEYNNLGLFIDQSLQQFAESTTDLRLKRLLLVPEGSSVLGSVRSLTSLDFRDNPFSPTTGSFTSFSAEWARTLTTEGSEFFSNFFKLSLTANAYLPILPRVVLAFQFRIGRIFSLDPASQTYPNRQFFLGGVDTMRGYPQDSMIPQELADLIAQNQASPDAILRGADAFMLLRGELRFPIYSALQGGIFCDLGNLWADARELNPLQLRPTVGFGLRIATPFGPIALDLGFIVIRRKTPLACAGLNCSLSQPYEPWGSFHFSIGLF